MTSTSEPIECRAQKSSISWVSAMPPIRAGVRAACADEGEDVEAQRLGRSADVHQGAVDGEQAQVGIDVDVGADGVDDQVEPAGELLERRRVGGGEVVVRTEAQAVLLLLQRLRQHGDLGAECVGDLHGHVTETAEADDRNPLAGSGAPAAQGA